MQGYDEYASDEIKDAVGPFGQILAGLFGGVGGATVAGAAERGGRAAARTLDPRRTMPEDMIARDPETMLPISRRNFANAAALMRSGFPSDLEAERARQALTEYLAEIGSDGAVGPGPHPTTALITDDPMMLARERRARSANSVPFIAADRAVMNDVSEKVRSVRPEAGDPAAAMGLAEAIAPSRRQGAAANVRSARDDLSTVDRSRQDLAATLATGRSPDQASRELDRAIVAETYVPERSRKNDLYETAARDPEAIVSTDEVRQTAQGEID
jgi:hypothetical protein